MKELPKFKRYKREYVIHLLTAALVHPKHLEETFFRRLIEYDDGHYGMVFSLNYFASDAEPTKSQWNSLKKKLKRHDKQIFVFKEYGVRPCEEVTHESLCGYIEFGFFAQVDI